MSKSMLNWQVASTAQTAAKSPQPKKRHFFDKKKRQRELFFWLEKCFFWRGLEAYGWNGCLKKKKIFVRLCKPLQKLIFNFEPKGSFVCEFLNLMLWLRKS